MRLATFIRENTEAILVEWEAFARALPMSASMNVEELRDHAKEILVTIAKDLETPQSGQEQRVKAGGGADSDEGGDHRSIETAAQSHGSERAGSGFTVSHMVAEFRALRASVLRLWADRGDAAAATELMDMIRFNEAIDQAIAESITRYTREVADSKDRFLAILGHDLRTPIGSIITSTRFMLDTGELQEPHLTLVSRIGSTSRRMHGMVEDLLDFTRARFGDSIPIERVDADLRRIIEDVVAEIAPSFPGTEIRADADGDLRGKWDSARLTQVITNLVANAAQHGSAGSPIEVVGRGEPERVAVSVHNRGPTIPKEQVGQLFEPMSQGMNGDGQDGGHLGLGLYIVDRIVEAHGGTVEVRSSDEDGTTFTVALPREG